MTPQERHVKICNALVRTIAYFDVISYAPTWMEVSAWLEWSGAAGFEVVGPPSVEELNHARATLIDDAQIDEQQGRIALHGRMDELLSLIAERSVLFPRKIRHARKVVRYLSHIASIRFVALVNTTALAHARNEGDLDFFIIAQQGRLWSTRLLTVSPYRMLGKLAHKDAKPDAVCFSYFISDDAPDLSSHCLPDDDPYFRYWFLSLLPLFDDGVGTDFWNANSLLRAKHPCATQWILPPDLAVSVPYLRVSVPRFAERYAKQFQERWFPEPIRSRKNLDTSVLISDDVLKFHTEDRRSMYREAYQKRLDILECN